MPGGLIQLAAYGSENIYLMGNPEITFFKVVYKHHTNFSVESIEIPFSNQHNISELSLNTTTLKIKIPRFADLLSHIFLKVQLPPILSSIYRKFQWCQNVGEIMVKSATLYIGGQAIETINSEWLNIYHQLNLPEDKRKIYDILIGNTPETSDPDISCTAILELIKRCFLEKPHPSQMSKHQNLVNEYSEVLGKIDSLIEGEEVEEASKTIRETMPQIVKDLLHLLENLRSLQTSNTPYYHPEQVIQDKPTLTSSIEGKQLYIPLPFFFTKNMGLSLPLIALQYHDVELQIEFSPISYLFTILDWDNEQKRYLRRRPNPLKETQRLSYYVYSHVPAKLPGNTSLSSSCLDDPSKNEASCLPDSDYNCSELENIKVVADQDIPEGPDEKNLATEQIIQQAYNNNNFIFQLSLEASFIFLDENERKLFAEQCHEYLIEQVTIRNDTGFHGKKSQMEMSLFHPVKEIIWTLKRSDAESYNLWFNYTNHLVDPIYRQLGNIFPNPYYGLPSDQDKLHKMDQMKNEILVKAKLLFNGIDRFDYKDATYLNYLQPYLYHSHSKNGIYLYSFSLEPEKYQPSGSVNMSMVNKLTLDFETTVPPIDPEISKVLNQTANPVTAAHLKNSFGIKEQVATGNNDYLSYVTDKEIFQYTYNLDVYVVNYNVLKIMGGMAGLAYN